MKRWRWLPIPKLTHRCHESSLGVRAIVLRQCGAIVGGIVCIVQDHLAELQALELFRDVVVEGNHNHPGRRRRGRLGVRPRAAWVARAAVLQARISQMDQSHGSVTWISHMDQSHGLSQGLVLT